MFYNNSKIIHPLKGKASQTFVSRMQARVWKAFLFLLFKKGAVMMSRLPELLAPGTLLGGRYKILKLAGSGGSSHVYEISDVKLSGKRWAVKQILPQHELGLRIDEEAAMLVSLDHPRLPRIVDFFPDEQNGVMYLVMDFIEGITLETYLRKSGIISEDTLRDIARQICEGLHYLHTREPPIVYRDLKPSNIMMEDTGELRFIDFGTARSYKPENEEDTVMLGTIGFAAPEQYTGKQSDQRTDLYALGAILLYLASSGKFTDGVQLNNQPNFRKDLSAAFSGMVRKLLRYEPAERYGSAWEVLAELKRFEATRPKGSFNEEAKRTTVIAVAGAAPGLGTTHLSVLLAHALSRRYSKITILEWDDKSQAFVSMRQELEPTRRRDEEVLFHIGKVAYRKKPTRMELLQLLNSGNGLVVMDLGSQIDKEGFEEFARADLQLVTIPGAVWRRQEIEKARKLFSAFGGRERAYIVTAADEAAIRPLVRELKGSKCHAVLPDFNPFEPSEASMEAVERICESILPKRPLSPAGNFREWLRKKNTKGVNKLL